MDIQGAGPASLRARSVSRVSTQENSGGQTAQCVILDCTEPSCVQEWGLVWEVGMWEEQQALVRIFCGSEPT